jgi:hypothetical protein
MDVDPITAEMAILPSTSAGEWRLAGSGFVCGDASPRIGYHSRD